MQTAPLADGVTTDTRTADSVTTMDLNAGALSCGRGGGGSYSVQVLKVHKAAVPIMVTEFDVDELIIVPTLLMNSDVC